MIFSASNLIFLFLTKRSQPTKGFYKSLKQGLYVDTQDDLFVQCVSPRVYSGIRSFDKNH
ncbi:MAG: hypothetical protein ACYTXC_11680 [Nostoc sp.]